MSEIRGKEHVKISRSWSESAYSDNTAAAEKHGCAKIAKILLHEIPNNTVPSTLIHGVRSVAKVTSCSPHSGADTLRQSLPTGLPSY